MFLTRWSHRDKRVGKRNRIGTCAASARPPATGIVDAVADRVRIGSNPLISQTLNGANLKSKRVRKRNRLVACLKRRLRKQDAASQEALGEDTWQQFRSLSRIVGTTRSRRLAGTRALQVRIEVQSWRARLHPRRATQLLANREKRAIEQKDTEDIERFKKISSYSPAALTY